MKQGKFIITGILLIIVLIGLFVLNQDNVLKSIISPNNKSSLQSKLQAIEDKIPTQTGKNNFLKQSENLTKDVSPELVDLDSQIITCDANIDGLVSANHAYGTSCVSGQGGTLSSIKGKFLSGQCCSSLVDTMERHNNLKKLQAYKNTPGIPLDPFHTPIDMAKKWIDYDNSTTLTADEQKVYDEAYAMSKEKPCCCKCWHYYTNEGISKKMIKDGVWNSKQIADYWDASDICGA